MKRALSLVVGFWLLTQPASAAMVGRSSPPKPHRHAATDTVAGAAARFAVQYRGVPYVWAGSSPGGFDCSGLTRYVYAHFGIDLPHSSYGQWSAGRHIPRSQLRAGDLVYFGTGHVGLWLGHGRFIHAPHTGEVVSVVRLAQSWYAASYSGAVRVADGQRPNATRPARPDAQHTRETRGRQRHR